MARNIATRLASPSVASPILVWNRSMEKAERLTAESEGKAAVAKEINEFATKCDVIICNLANDSAVRSVYEKFSEALKVTFSA